MKDFKKSTLYLSSAAVGLVFSMGLSSVSLASDYRFEEVPLDEQMPGSSTSVTIVLKKVHRNWSWLDLATLGLTRVVLGSTKVVKEEVQDEPIVVGAAAEQTNQTNAEVKNEEQQDPDKMEISVENAAAGTGMDMSLDTSPKKEFGKNTLDLYREKEEIPTFIQCGKTTAAGIIGFVTDASEEDNIVTLKIMQGVHVQYPFNNQLVTYTSEGLKKVEGVLKSFETPMAYKATNRKILYPPSMVGQELVVLEGHTGDFENYYNNGPTIIPIFSNLYYKLDSEKEVEGSNFIDFAKRHKGIHVMEIRTRYATLWPAPKKK